MGHSKFMAGTKHTEFRIEPWGTKWIHGSPSRKHPTDPPLQIQAFDSRTFVIRESKDISYEAPFIYLFIGEDRALLLDTGATADAALFPIRRAVEHILAEAIPEGDGNAPLIVAHTHGHGDHVAGDSQFREREHTVLVGRELDSVKSFFGFEKWPCDIRELDIGGRTLEIFGIPGHHPASVAVYDADSEMLVTGDTVYPGRLYIHDMEAFLDSMERLVEFTSSRKVKYVMGCHVEMTRTPGKDYPVGTVYQPDEHPLPMSVSDISLIGEAAKNVHESRGAHFFDGFAIFNGPCRTAIMKELVRAWGTNLKHRLN